MTWCETGTGKVSFSYLSSKFSVGNPASDALMCMCFYFYQSINHSNQEGGFLYFYMPSHLVD